LKWFGSQSPKATRTSLGRCSGRMGPDSDMSDRIQGQTVDVEGRQKSASRRLDAHNTGQVIRKWHCLVDRTPAPCLRMEMAVPLHADADSGRTKRQMRSADSRLRQRPRWCRRFFLHAIYPGLSWGSGNLAKWPMAWMTLQWSKVQLA